MTLDARARPRHEHAEQEQACSSFMAPRLGRPLEELVELADELCRASPPRATFTRAALEVAPIPGLRSGWLTARTPCDVREVPLRGLPRA